MPENVSKRNLKHISKHLLEFQKYNSAITLNDLIELGQSIAQNPENLIKTSKGRQVFEKEVIIGEQAVRNSFRTPVKVRVVLNSLGNLRSVHIRY